MLSRDPLLPDLASRLSEVEERIAEAAVRSGRKAEEVRLIVVTKQFPMTVIRNLLELGVQRFGENYTRELSEKWPHFPHCEWHLIGPVQSRPLKELKGLLEGKGSQSSLSSSLWIQTVDSRERLQRIYSRLGKIPPFLIQVNVGREPQKFGILEESLFTQVEEIFRFYPQAPLQGLMTIPPFHEDPQKGRPYYTRLRKLRDELEKRFGLKNLGLSMGMSHDYPIAIEEGATWVRIGQAILGPRM